MIANKPRITKLNSFYGNKIGYNYRYKYFCKSRSFKANFTDSEFSHVNFRGSIMTSCCFRRCKFNGVEFLGTNLRHSNFEGAHFKDAIFVGASIDGCNFKNATFEDVIFVNTSLDNTKNLIINNLKTTILSKYPKINISSELKNALDALRDNTHISRFKVLHLTTKKYNHLNLKILLDIFSEEELIAELRIAKEKIEKDICTVSCLKKFLFTELKA